MTPNEKPEKGEILRFPGDKPGKTGEIVGPKVPRTKRAAKGSDVIDGALTAEPHDPHGEAPKVPGGFDACPKCGKLPELREVPGMKAPVPIQCPCKMAMFEADKAAQARRGTLTNWRTAHKDVLPEKPLHAGHSLDKLDDLPETRRGVTIARAFLDAAPDHLAKGHGLLLWGKPGTGKGRVSLALAGDLEAIGYRVMTIHHGELTRASFTDDYPALLAALTSADFVVVDELGYSGDNVASFHALDTLVGARYEAGRSTVATANFDLADLFVRYESYVLRSEVETAETARLKLDRWFTRMLQPRYVPVEFSGRDLREVYQYDPFEGL